MSQFNVGPDARDPNGLHIYSNVLHLSEQRGEIKVIIENCIYNFYRNKHFQLKTAENAKEISATMWRISLWEMIFCFHIILSTSGIFGNRLDCSRDK